MQQISLFFQLSSAFPCFSCLFLLLCLYLLLFSQLLQKVVTSYDVLVLWPEVRDLLASATEPYFGFFFCLFALFVFKKERIFRLPLFGCGLSTSCWGLMWWSFLEDTEGRHVIQPDDQNLCFEGCQAAQHFPKVTPRVELFCCTHYFCSAIVSLCSEEAFLGSTASLCCLQGVGCHQDCNSGALCSGNDTVSGWFSCDLFCNDLCVLAHPFLIRALTLAWFLAGLGL